MSCEGINQTFLEALASALYKDADGNTHINFEILQTNCEDLSPYIDCSKQFGNVEAHLLDAFGEDACGNKTLRVGIPDNIDLSNIIAESIETDSLLLTDTVWDDMRVVPGSFDRPGIKDPEYVIYYPNAGGIGVYLPEFNKDDFACFTIQLPHTYKEGEDIYVHLHWTPGAIGNEESGKLVGWKLDYTWANISGTFSDMQTIDLSDECDGMDHKHQMTHDVLLTGIGAGKTISSMILCNIRRTDGGADDTWGTNTAGNLPLFLEVDFHFPIDTLGSSTHSTK